MAISEPERLTRRKSKQPNESFACIAWFWLFFVHVLSIAVLVIVAKILLTLGFRKTVEFHRHPSEHRDNSHPVGFEVETRFSS